MLHWLCDSPRMGCAWRITPYIYVARTRNKRVIVAWKICRYQLVNDWTKWPAHAKSDHGMWTLLLLAARVRSFAHMPLGISDRNSSRSRPSPSDILVWMLSYMKKRVSCWWIHKYIVLWKFTAQTLTKRMCNYQHFQVLNHFCYGVVELFRWLKVHSMKKHYAWRLFVVTKKL